MSETFLTIDVSDATEPTSAPGGEYTVILRSAEIKPSAATGNLQIVARLEIEDQPDFKDVFDYIRLPNLEMTPKEVKQVRWNLRMFCESFNIFWDGSQYNLASGIGNRTWAVLTETDDPQYGRQNRVKQFVHRG